MDPTEHEKNLIGTTSEIVVAFVTSNATSISDLPGLISSTYAALAALGAPAAPETAKQEPYCSIRKSITPDYLISLEDGSRHKTLKRHLQTAHGLSPEQYREKWDLPKDYPMVAPNYSKQRADLARKIGLGTKGRK